MKDDIATAREQRLTIKEVKKIVLETLRRVRDPTVQKVVMKHGGKITRPSGDDCPSLRALPVANYAACVAELKALPDAELPELRDLIETAVPTTRGADDDGIVLGLAYALEADDDGIVLGLAYALEAIDEHADEYAEPALAAWIESVREQMLALQAFLSENYLD